MAAMCTSLIRRSGDRPMVGGYAASGVWLGPERARRVPSLAYAYVEGRTRKIRAERTTRPVAGRTIPTMNMSSPAVRDEAEPLPTPLRQVALTMVAVALTLVAASSI